MNAKAGQTFSSARINYAYVLEFGGNFLAASLTSVSISFTFSRLFGAANSFIRGPGKQQAEERIGGRKA